MREAALIASTHSEPQQRSVAFHEQRLREIGNGDHDLEEVDPQLVAHFIPEGYPQANSLCSPGEIDEEPPAFVRSQNHVRSHEYGKITKPANDSQLQRGYNLLMHCEGIETVSGTEISDFNGEEVFLASRTEAKIAATANWAQSRFEELPESDHLAVMVTLVGVEQEDIRIPDKMGARWGIREASFNSERISPWPASIPVGDIDPAETYNQLSVLFGRLWSDAGISGTGFYRNGSDALGTMRDYL